MLETVCEYGLEGRTKQRDRHRSYSGEGFGFRKEERRETPNDVTDVKYTFCFNCVGKTVVILKFLVNIIGLKVDQTDSLEGLCWMAFRW